MLEALSKTTKLSQALLKEGKLCKIPQILEMLKVEVIYQQSKPVLKWSVIFQKEVILIRNMIWMPSFF